jgi:hypothetical protein
MKGVGSVAIYTYTEHHHFICVTKLTDRISLDLMHIKQSLASINSSTV